MAESRPSVLIIGGLGFIGRFLARHLHENGLASEVRIVDKQLPQLAWLAPEFEEACCRAAQFVQGDMSRDHTAEKVFARDDGSTWDYVFNCGGDSRFSQDDEIYKQRSVQLSVTAAREAARRGVRCWVELSSGTVYKPERDPPRKEADRLKPWTRLAKYKLEAEDELQKIQGLNLVILRLANVYGPYCSKLMGTVLCMGRVYAYLGDEMKWLWTKDLRTHTVHVLDVARAVWHAADWYARGKHGWDEPTMGRTPVFNVVDHGDTNQGTVRTHIANIFGIKTGFHGTIFSQFAKLNMHSVVDEANDALLQPWGQLLAQAKIVRPGPINPYLEQELLGDSDLSLDGSRLGAVTGFVYQLPEVTEHGLREMIASYERLNWWPPIHLKPAAPPAEAEAEAGEAGLGGGGK